MLLPVSALVSMAADISTKLSMIKWNTHVKRGHAMLSLLTRYVSYDTATKLLKLLIQPGLKPDLKYLFSSDLFAAHPSLPVRIILPDWEQEDGPMKALGLGTITNDLQFSEVTGTNRKRIHRVLFPPLSAFRQAR
ncbi:predicted protein [Histoplasma capsulatum G186AR]|uniref:Uncharacterized protein n=2 Tax=Ajellomyces capsulatus TaxID=5037 RepID=C0NJ17_AJECG|nr:uncharacterized protein HCBG_03147 [Histoplasma capsulatum G186AR]EEH07858.1 predicted protein [Histoplasma capsulatum G186AR]